MRRPGTISQRRRITVCERQQTGGERVTDELRAAFEAELRHDAADVRFHGRLSEKQLACDLTV